MRHTSVVSRSRDASREGPAVEGEGGAGGQHLLGAEAECPCRPTEAACMSILLLVAPLARDARGVLIASVQVGGSRSASWSGHCDVDCVCHIGQTPNCFTCTKYWRGLQGRRPDVEDCVLVSVAFTAW